MKIAYQVKLGDPIMDGSIGRNAWFPDAEKAMTESYVLMEQLEEKYGSFFIWDAGIPFKNNEDNTEIVILQGIMPGITTKDNPFYLQLNRKQVQDYFEFDEPNHTKIPLDKIQVIVRKNIGRYFNKVDQMGV